MNTVRISVTEASRNFSECVNRARYQGTSFVLLKGGSPLARTEPAEAQPRRGRELAAAFAKAVEDVHVGEEEATSWLHDLEQARGAQGRRGDFSPWRF